MKKETFSDILFEFPWTCGEKDCDHQWHKSTYWWNQVGKKTSYTIDNYSDGDHKPILKKDLPTPYQQDKAWKKYRAYVAQSGKDPLNLFILPQPKTTTHIMQALVRQGVGRVLLKGIRKKGKLSPWVITNIPQHVIDYLDLTRKNRQAPWVLNGSKTLVELKKMVRQAKQGDRVIIRTPKEAVIDFKVVEVIPWKASEIKAHLKEIASRQEKARDLGIHFIKL